MNIPFSLNRIFALVRSVANPGAAGTGIVDNTPVIPVCDPFGVTWVRQFIGGHAGGGTTPVVPGLPPTAVATSNPGAGVKASASLPADGSGQGGSNVASTLSWSIGDTAAIASATVVLRDGASGVGPILWQKEIGPLPVNSYVQGEIQFPFGVGPFGTATTAMTLEFLAAPAATGIQSVSISGYLAK